MGKKTIRIADLLERANWLLEQENVDQSRKSQMRSVIETVLMSTDNYNGFMFNDGNHGNTRPEDVTYGIKNHLVREYMDFQKVREDKGGWR